nr:hypothetical protein [Tanacetum cinerariifolium]
MKKKNQIELDAEYAKKLHEEINKDYKEINKDYKEINKDIDWDVSIDHVKQKSKNPQYIKRYQVMKKRPRTEKAQEAEDLKKRLEVVDDEDDDLILLVERRYPLSRFTLEQLVNVIRLHVEEESEMSLELLRFTRQ